MLYGATDQLRVLVDDESAIGEGRRVAQKIAGELGLDATGIGQVGIVASELGTNLWRHAGGGVLLIQALGKQVEILAIDRGGGMQDVNRCLVDGYSTGGTAGQGLGAVRRLAAEFDFYSQPGQGTVIMARLGQATPVAFGAVCVALRGEIHCGDTWRLAYDGAEIAACVVDGLGHGTLAAESAQLMADAFVAAPLEEPKSILERAHSRMSGTRGAAGACSRMRASRALSYAGVGNISGHRLTDQSLQGLVSHGGILGVQTRRVQQFEYSPAHDALLVMHSDGVSARWDLQRHPGLTLRHPAIIAGILYRDHGRARDDATVLVVRQ
jgi:anti-sigma regulatory factor (Ser/Thr protein kinase)